MKKRMSFLLAMAMLLCLCACDNTPATEEPTASPTIQGQPDPTKPADPADPPVTASPVGVYGCTGISTEGPDNYQEMGYGQLCIYEDHTGDIYFDDYYHDFTWVMEGDRFIATTNDEPSISIEGTLKAGIMELVYEGNVYLRFQQQTQQELDQLAVDFLRECMVDTAQKMAVAYLGWYEGEEDFSGWLSKSCPKLLEEYPFIASVPEEQIIGQFGEVYCLVPKDEQANVTIGLLKNDDSGEIAKVLHQSNNGEPLLLICNYDGSYPNMQVTVQETTGEELVFYPQIGRMGGVVIPKDDSLEELMFDFTDYFEVYQDYYTAMLVKAWYFADEEHLISTCWNHYEDTLEDRCWVLNVSGDGTVQMDLLLDGVPVDAEHYEGTWGLNYSDDTGLTYLYLDILRDDGKRINDEYVVLKCNYSNGILLGIHEDQERPPFIGNGETVSFWWGSVG